MNPAVFTDTLPTGSDNPDPNKASHKIPSPKVDKCQVNGQPKLSKTWQKLGPLISTSSTNRKMYQGYEIAVKNDTYTCITCGFVVSGSRKTPSRKSNKSDNRRLIKLHIKSKHFNAFRCEPCEKDYTSYTILQTHLRKMHSTGKLPTHVCEICGKTVSNIDLHSWNYHKSPEEKEQVIQSGEGFGLISCDKCGKEFSGEDKLISHQTQGNRCKGAKAKVENVSAVGTSGEVKSDNSHSNPSKRKLQCRICGRFVTFYSHAQHEWTHKNEAEKEESIRLGTSPKVRCHICDTYVLHSGYKAHLDVHKNPEEIKHLVCDWDGCGRKFARKSYLALHIKTFHHRSQPPPVGKPKLDLTCPDPSCSSLRFTSKPLLNSHIARRHKSKVRSERPLKCDICHAGFLVRIDFTRHQKSHLPRETYTLTCPHCPILYAKQNLLRRHLTLEHSAPKESRAKSERIYRERKKKQKNQSADDDDSRPSSQSSPPAKRRRSSRIKIEHIPDEEIEIKQENCTIRDALSDQEEKNLNEPDVEIKSENEESNLSPFSDIKSEPDSDTDIDTESEHKGFKMLTFNGNDSSSDDDGGGGEDPLKLWND